MSIRGVFRLEDHDKLPQEWCCDNGTRLIVEKTYDATGTIVIVQGVGFVEEGFDSFNTQSATVQKELLTPHVDKTGSNKIEREAQFSDLVERGQLPRQEKSLVVLPSQISSLMPTVERTSSDDYRNAESVILKTLQTVAKGVIMTKDEDGHLVEDPRLQTIRADLKRKMGEEIDDAIALLKAHNPRLQNVEIDPNIDFTGAMKSVTLKINMGAGARDLSQQGSGTNRRMWMALQRWQYETSRDEGVGSTISLYDEPDTNLHVTAQRDLYLLIAKRAEDTAARTQCLISTHSVHLIDNAPAETIQLLEMDEHETRRARSISSVAKDPEVRNFLKDTGKALGLTNTALLYERAFLLVEGLSEWQALPTLYRRIYGRSVTSDGITILDLGSCGAWESALRVLFANRKEVVHLLLDQDCIEPNSSAKLTPKRIKGAGLPDDFLTNQVTFVGAKEYEDAFPDEALCRVLNEFHPREDGTQWDASHLAAARSSDKFSDAIVDLINKDTMQAKRQGASKPDFAQRVALRCTDEEIPAAVRDAFERVRVCGAIASTSVPIPTT